MTHELRVGERKRGMIREVLGEHEILVREWLRARTVAEHEQDAQHLAARVNGHGDQAAKSELAHEVPLLLVGEARLQERFVDLGDEQRRTVPDGAHDHGTAREGHRPIEVGEDRRGE